ncbi:fatty acyl-AMP ligase [Sphaerisporangium flaviroseum]|uniref:Fatty acyl-AMP ligase n=1 Tax=Sphaerisporangium flaviroseum TaxID=509199 RepID=A0ABP7I545_9ACTN
MGEPSGENAEPGSTAHAPGGGKPRSFAREPEADAREPLIARMARWAAEIPDAPAYTFVAHPAGCAPAGVEHTLTWAEVDLRARALAVRLRDATPAGERAAILAPSGLEYVVALLGAMYARVIAVPLFPPDLPGHAERLIRAYGDADPMAVLTTTASLPGVEAFLSGTQRPKSIVTVDTVSSLLAEEWEPEPSAADDVAYLQYTSGSTRAPAAVQITHGNLTANAEQLWTAFRARPRTSVAALWLPLFHDMGLVASVAAPILGGNRSVFMDPVAFVMHPVRWLTMLSRYDDVFSGAPNFAYEYTAGRVTEDDKKALDLSGVSVLLNGAEPIRPCTMERFGAAFVGCGLRPSAQTPAYGLAEATVFVTAMDRDAPPKVVVFDRKALTEGRAVPVEGGDHRDPGGGSALVAVGRPTRQWVIVTDPETGLERRHGEVGEIRVQGPNVARAYWRDPERSAEVFADGWLRTGDLGVIHEGDLYVTGRIKDLIIVDGRNHYPQDIEVTVQEADAAIRRDHVAAFAIGGEDTERLVVVAERSRRAGGRDPDEVAAGVRAAVTRGHELRLHDFLLVEPGTVPRTSSGKVARQACRQAYLDGVLAGSARER